MLTTASILQAPHALWGAESQHRVGAVAMLNVVSSRKVNGGGGLFRKEVPRKGYPERARCALKGGEVPSR